MNEKEEKLINIVSNHIDEFACELGYSYLRGGYDKWENGRGETHSIKSMDRDYLNNCIAFIDKGIEDIEVGTIDKEVEGKLIPFAKQNDRKKELRYMRLEVTEPVVEEIKSNLKETLLEKKNELSEYL